LLMIAAMHAGIAPARAQTEASRAHDWLMPAGDHANTRYSELAQLNTGNVKDLKLVFSFSTGVLRGHEAAPIVAGGTMYDRARGAAMKRACLGAVLVLAGLAACEPTHQRRVSWGNSDRGAQLIRAYGCGSCHSIPGIQRADSKVGPPLRDLSERVYIAGVITNTPQHLMQWIQHPRAVDSRTAMPELGVTPDDARDIAAYLYSR